MNAGERSMLRSVSWLPSAPHGRMIDQVLFKVSWAGAPCKWLVLLGSSGMVLALTSEFMVPSLSLVLRSSYPPWHYLSHLQVYEFTLDFSVLPLENRGSCGSSTCHKCAKEAGAAMLNSDRSLWLRDYKDHGISLRAIEISQTKPNEPNWTKTKPHQNQGNLLQNFCDGIWMFLSILLGLGPTATLSFFIVFSLALPQAPECASLFAS